MIITALMAVTLFSRLAWFGGGGEEFGLYAFALKDAGGEVLQPAVYLGILLSAAALLPLVTVFLYRRRLLQIRLCVAEMVLRVGGAVLEGVYYYLGGGVVWGLSFAPPGVGFAFVFPLVCLRFAWVALRVFFRL